MTNNVLSGYASDLRSKHEQQEKSVSKRTLGMVAQNSIDRPRVQTIPDEVSEVYSSATVQIELTEADIEEIESLVAERNARNEAAATWARAYDCALELLQKEQYTPAIRHAGSAAGAAEIL